VAELVRFTLDDGTEVFFESAESEPVGLRGGEPDVSQGGKLQGKLQAVAAAAEEVASAVRSKLAPDDLTMEFGVKVSGEVNWWFFAKNAGEATIKVTLTWAGAAKGTTGNQ
jgi:hypothetical protein